MFLILCIPCLIGAELPSLDAAAATQVIYLASSVEDLKDSLTRLGRAANGFIG
jgi:hypothetical protein